MRWIFLLVVVVTFYCCKSKELSLNDLQHAKWDSLTLGASIISTENEKGIYPATDSVNVQVKGISERQLNPYVQGVDASNELKEIFATILNPYAPDSKSGYLRLNLNEYAMRNIIVTIDLRPEGDDTKYPFNIDSLMLVKMQGVKSVQFVSKEMAAKKYAEFEDSSWKRVLTDTPFPETIEVSLDARRWTQSELEDLKQQTEQNIRRAVEVQYPSIFFKTPSAYLYFQYRRIKK